MKKTVLITGSSSGIGRASALWFKERDWNVIASMRTPGKEKELTQLKDVWCPALDVTQPDSIAAAVAGGIEHFGGIDAVVNNAGYALSGPFELATEQQLHAQFETNVFGCMKVAQAILPHFRSRKGGVLVNVSSMGGRLTFPLYSVYHSSKWALEGFTESLAFELMPLNVRVKLVEPGAIKTDFYDRSADRTQTTGIAAYDAYTRKLSAKMDKAGQQGASPERVAKVIYRAANDGSSRLRYPVGTDAKALLWLRRLLPDGAFRRFVRLALGA